MRAFERYEDREDAGFWAVLYGEDEHGEVELDTSPNQGDWEREARYLNAHPDDLAEAIAHARNKTGPWSPRWTDRDGRIHAHEDTFACDECDGSGCENCDGTGRLVGYRANGYHHTPVVAYPKEG